MKSLLVIDNWTITSALIMWFLTFFIHQKVNIGFYIKRALKFHVTTGIKVLDCYPCFSFWITLFCTFEPLTAIIVFLIATFLDRK